jgi:hypothetical protein
MILDNQKVAKFLGFGYAQFCRLLKVGALNVGSVMKSKGRNSYYILRGDLEKLINRKLTEEEFEYLKK